MISVTPLSEQGERKKKKKNYIWNYIMPLTSRQADIIILFVLIHSGKKKALLLLCSDEPPAA